jgi:hypothetical protein
MANHAVVRLRHLFNGADEGWFTLPAEITVARAAVDALKAASPTPRKGNEEAVAEKLLEYVLANGRMPVGWESNVLPASIEGEHQNAASLALKRAQERAEDRCLAVCLEMVDETITHHLRPKLAEAIALVAPFAEAAVGLPWHAPSSFFKPENNAMLDALAEGNAIYEAIRHGQSVLREVSGSPDSEASLFFGEFKAGIRTVWPTFRTQMQAAPPWGQREGPARFAWLVANVADELWMPTAAQVDVAYRSLVRESGLKQAGLPV